MNSPVLDQLLEDYLGYMLVKKGRPRSPGHIREVKRRVSRMLRGAALLDDVTPEFIETRMRELLEQHVWIKGEIRQRSTQTVDHHRRELGTFFRWVVRKRGLLEVNPVDAVDAYDSCDVRDPSRPLSPAEYAVFFEGVSVERLPIYLFWATTGLRVSETRRLTWAQIFLEPSECEPYVQILRAGAKNRKAIRQPLHPDVVALLRPLQWSPERPVFLTIPTERTFIKDLEKVGLGPARIKPEGRLTRMSLRKLFATDLDRAGASEGVVQKLMRHSSPELTRARYTHFDLEEKSQWVGRLRFLPEWRRADSA